MHRGIFALAGALTAGSLFAYCAAPHSILHLWGNGIYDPRPGHPEDLLNFTNFTPRKIANFQDKSSPNLVKVSFGTTHEVGLDDKGDIYIWPIHIVNSVSLPEIDDHVRDVKKLSSGGNYTQLQWTKGILFALNKKGEVWEWRFDLQENPVARRIPRLKNIKKISTGYDHLVALDNEGHCWSMGDDTFGQCGQSFLNRTTNAPYLSLRYPNPMMIYNIEGKVIDIACGKQHTIALLEDGSVLGWGRNHKQQFGLFLESDNKTAKQVIYLPTEVNGSSDKKIVKIAAGDYFSLYVAETRTGEEEVYATGLNSRGQLGLGFLTHCTSFVKVQQLSNFVVTDPKNGKINPVKYSQLECGSEHCMALMDVGAVYIWGGNENGEQGNKKRTIQDKPRIMKYYIDKEVVSINCGQKGSAVIWKDI
ncbi:unnamed protein product [Blepharisma stoltei]|uniref:RCC1-like domain-containing protein n=1 Tax=Blepharisma stoltei TaxID=1481888 RepID=A0AAU9JZI8_9CILI|nr:unnamed protein product [Blepharisma stoltei]